MKEWLAKIEDHIRKIQRMRKAGILRKESVERKIWIGRQRHFNSIENYQRGCRGKNYKGERSKQCTKIS